MTNVLGNPFGVEALSLVVKASLLLGAALACAALLKRRSAAARHFVWILALSGLLALPLLAPAPTKIAVPVPFLPVTETAGSGLAARALENVNPWTRNATPRATISAAPRTAALPAAPSRSAPSWPVVPVSFWLTALWLAGFLAVIAWHVLGYAGLTRLVRKASPSVDPRWHWIVGQSARETGVRQSIELRKSAAVGSPLVCGVGRLTILLPLDADEWPEDRRRAVALHELAHVARRDVLAQWIAGLACAVWWFHPGVWAAARRMRAESERACDDRVVGLGVPAAEYATHLLEITRKARTLRLAGAVAIGMARRSTLEGRLLSLLDAGRARGALSRRARLTSLALCALAVAVFAGIRPVARAAATPSDAVTVEPATSESMEAPAPVATAPAATMSAPVAETTTEPPPGKSISSALEVAASEMTAALDENTTTTLHDAVTIDSGDKGGSWADEDGIPYHGRFDLGPGGTLRLRLDTGAGVQIQGWSKNVVEFEGLVGGRNREDVGVEMQGRGGEASLRLEALGKHQGNFSTSSHFLIRVPKRFDVEIQSAGGEITIEGVEGTFGGTTGGGEITLRNVAGRARLSTGGGDIDVSDSDLGGTVSTGGGLVKISRVRGGLRGSSGSGPVMYTDTGEGEKGSLDGVEIDATKRRVTYSPDARSDGALHLEKAGGDIHLTEAPNGARVNTGGGDVRIGRTNGMVKATTGGGNIRLGPVAGSLVATTGAGQVWVTLSGRDADRTIDLSSGYGTIILEVPRGLGVDLDLETSYTRAKEPSHIRSDIPVEIESSTGWDDSEGTPRKYVRAHATSGSGRVRVRVKTVNGDIEIRPAR